MMPLENVKINIHRNIEYISNNLNKTYNIKIKESIYI